MCSFLAAFILMSFVHLNSCHIYVYTSLHKRILNKVTCAEEREEVNRADIIYGSKSFSVLLCISSHNCRKYVLIKSELKGYGS